MKRKANVLPAATFVLLLALVAVSGCQRADVEQAAAVNETESKDNPTMSVTKSEATSPEETGGEARVGDGSVVARSGEAEARAGNGMARAGDAVAGNGEAKAGDVVAGGGESAEERDAGAQPGSVKLQIRGQPGTQFSGTCAVGDEEREVSGRAPARFVYEPGDRELACEIHTGGPDAGPLKFSVTADGSNRKQRIKVTGDTMNFSFSGNNISYSTSSASGNAVQSSSVSSSSYSSSSVSSSSGR